MVWDRYAALRLTSLFILLLNDVELRTSRHSKGREGKFLPLFNVVQFKNDACTSTNSFATSGTSSRNRNGTCHTTSECSTRGGTAGGSCAAGFGVCCVFVFADSGKTTSQNCSYLQNPSFPRPFPDTSRVTYTIRKCEAAVCRLRLDFESFTIRGTGNALEGDGVAPSGGICLDTFTVTTNTGTTIPTICGQNAGQHIYVDIGREPADLVELNFNFDGTVATRMWEIKVTQLTCNSEGHPTSSGCLQYHTGIAGRFSTFNFIPTNDNHLANQEYSICIRQEEGMCCIEYQACSDDNSFSINAMAIAIAMQDNMCLSLDYVGIEAVTASCTEDLGSITVSQFCGNKLNPNPSGSVNVAVCDCVEPFQVDIFTNAMADIGPGLTAQNTQPSRGVCLDYRQIPC